MTTSKYLLLALIWALPNLLVAQHIYKIDLNPQETEISNQRLYVASVTDKRVKKKFLGTIVRNGAINALQFEDSFEEELHLAFLNIYPYGSNQIPVHVVVHDLRIAGGVIVNDQQEGNVAMELEFFHPDTTNSLYTFKKTATYRALDVRKKHKNAIEELLASSLLSANEYMETQIVAGEIDTMASSAIKFPLPKGVYPNFIDMVNRTPEPIEFTTRRLGEKLKRYDIKASDEDRKNIKRAFCVSDGQNLYVNARAVASNRSKENPFNASFNDQPLKVSHYLKAHFTGRYIYLEDRFTKGYLSVTFGLVGALAGSRKLGIVLDTNGGKFHVLERTYLKELLDNYPEQKEAYNATKRNLEAKKNALRLFNDSIGDE